MNQPPYSSFVKNTALVKFGATTSDDIKLSTISGSDAIVKISISITQSLANLKLHENNRFEV